MNRWSTLLIPLATACASTSFRHQPMDAPHAEVHVRMYYYDHYSSGLEESFGINGRPVRRPYESKFSSIPTKVALVPPGQRARVTVGAVYDKEISTERKILTAALITSDNEALEVAGWLLFADSQTPGDTCEAAINLQPEAGARYLIEYRYLGERGCAARCRRVLSDINAPTPDRTARCDGVAYERLVDRTASEAVDVRLHELLAAKAFTWRMVPSGLEVTTSSVADLASGDVITRIGYSDGMGRDRIIQNLVTTKMKRVRVGASRRLILRVVRDRDERVVVLD